MNTTNRLSYSICLLLGLFSSATIPCVLADNLFVIDFEDYGTGNLTEMQPPQREIFRWQALKGTAEVQTDIVHGGKQALRLGPARSLVMRRFDGGIGIRPLPSQTQYYDFWVYPDCGPSDYIVIARLSDIKGPTFVDVQFDNRGAIKVLTKPENAEKPKYVEVDGAWESRQWNRVTLKLDVATQKFELFLGGKPCMKSPLPFGAEFSGKLFRVTFEGPSGKQELFACYYDDLHWSDTNPLATK